MFAALTNFVSQLPAVLRASGIGRCTLAAQLEPEQPPSLQLTSFVQPTAVFRLPPPGCAHSTFSPSLQVNHGMVFVPAGYCCPSTQFDNSEVHGGSPWGAGCLAGPDGSRQVRTGRSEAPSH